MPKFSVKKPFTVFVAVIAILVLGVVSYLRMTPDLLPNMDFPYVMIMTTYPGASPEKVEMEITRPMEQAMSTLEHIKGVSSTSSDSYSMVLLEFEESVNMDTIGVDIQQNINSLSSDWDDMVSTPYVLKINPSMLPVEVAAVSMEGMTPMELSEFLDDTLMNKLEGISGVARISTTGTITQELHVVLDQKKIDDLNAKIQAHISGEIGDAVKELEDQKQELEDAQKELDNAQRQLNAGKQQLSSQTASAAAQLQQMRAELNSAKVQLQAAQIGLQALQEAVNAADRHLAAKQQEIADLVLLQQQIAALDQEKLAAESQKAEITANPDLTEEEKAEQIQAIDTAIGEKEQALNASLAAAGVTADTISLVIGAKEQELAGLRTAVEMVEQRLAEEGLDRAQLTQALLDINSGLAEVENGLRQLDAAEQPLEQSKTAGMLELSGAASEISLGRATIEQALTQIDGGLDTLKDSEADALKQADLDKIITMDMVTQILVAQNFAMPAGYIAQDGVSYMVSVGDEIDDVESLENLLLFDMGIEGIDPIYLKDVAGVMLTDNRDATYAKLDGENSIMLSFEKQSTYATAETTNNINARFRQLEEEYPGLQFVSLMNQGDYIYLIVESILSSLLLGAVRLSPAALWQALLEGPNSTAGYIFWYARLPRTLACLLSGAALAVSGAVIQAVLSNKLASPGIIGVNAGAGLAVTVCCAMGLLSGWTIALSAFGGAMVSVLLVVFAARKTGASRTTVILGGVAVNSFLNALSEALTTLIPDAGVLSGDFRVGGFSSVHFV